MSVKTKEMPQLADAPYAAYAHTLVIKSTLEYKVHWPHGSKLVFMSTFNDQSMSIGCINKLGHLFGFLRHYFLNSF